VAVEGYHYGMPPDVSRPGEGFLQHPAVAQVHPVKDHPLNAAVNRILASRQAVWVATNAGVFKYDRAMQRWVQFTVEDGLADDRVYSIQLDGDYIYFGTARGLTKFYWNSPFRND